jgi:hypothetical protein
MKRTLLSLMRRLAMIGIVATTAALSLTACSSSHKPQPLSGPPGVQADVGFRPDANGFSFVNYGDTLDDGSTPTNLTDADVRAMFGDGVCASIFLDRCTLKPEARAWEISTNQAMADGHCYGFSVAAELLWQQQLNPQKFGAPATTSLDILNNTDLQSQIAYEWSLQLLSSVQSKKVTGTPNQILAQLRTLLTSHPADTYTLAIWKPNGDGGHAVTPYQVVNKGGGQFQVLIYDNNYPNDLTRAISFDTVRDTWSYNAASNPSDPTELYQGNSSTKSVILFPTAPGQGVQKCPFCGKVPSTSGGLGAAGATEVIYLDGAVSDHANLVVTDHSGHRLGVVNGKLVDQIPGANFTPVLGGTFTNQFLPYFFVPANQTYTLSLDASAMKQSDTETLGIIGPGFNLSVDDISVHPGDKYSMVAAPYATEITYAGSRPSSPTFEFGVSNTQADYAFDVSGLATQAKGTTTFALPAEGGNLTMKTTGNAPASSVDLQMTRFTPQGTQTFNHGGVALASGDSAQLQFANWTDPSQAIPLVTTHNKTQTTQDLANQPSAAAAPGSTGPSSAAGTQGATGAGGAAGTQGATGASGAAGTQGATGASGPAGPQGATGASGPAGPQGATGPAGPSGPAGPPGPSGVTNDWQASLVGGSVVIGQQPTLIVRSPSLPAGNYAVTAQLTVAGSNNHNPGNDQPTVEVDCWVTPNSAGISSNADGVRVATDITAPTQSLDVNDLITTTNTSDQIDLVCSASTVGGPQQQVSATHASIIVSQITHATK